MRTFGFFLIVLAFLSIGFLPLSSATPSVIIGSLYIDSSAQANCGNTTHACSVTGFSTTNPNDLILAYQDTHLDANACSLNGMNMTDSAKLVWTQRASSWNLTATTPQLVEYWAIALNPLSSDNLTEYIFPTVTPPFCSGSPPQNTYNGLTVIAFSGLVQSNRVLFDSPNNWLQAMQGSSPNENVTGTFRPSTQAGSVLALGGVAHGSNIAYGSCCNGITGSGTNQGVEYQILNGQSSQITFSSTALSNWAFIVDAIVIPVGNSGNPTIGGPGNFQSVNGPGGYPIPPQLGDNGVLGFIFLVSATIAISSLEFPKRERKKRSPYG